jgi:Family of unknown function (DUF6263)
MKLKKILVATVIVLFLAACATTDKLALQLNFQKGKKYYYTTVNNQTIEQSFMGQTTTNSKKTTTGYIYEIKDINKEGNYNVTITYDKVDVEKSESKERKSPIADDFMKGFSFDMVVTPKGKVVQVSGMEKLMDKAMDAVLKTAVNADTTIQNAVDEKGNPVADTSMNDDAAKVVMKPVMDMIKNQFSDKNMSSMMEQLTNYFPESDVEVGDKWENVATLNTFVSMKIATTYKVVDMTDDIVKLDVDAKITSGEGAGIMGMKMDLDGTQAGTMEIDVKTGLVLKSSINQNIKGTIKMMGMEIPMKINGTNTLEAREMN